MLCGPTFWMLLLLSACTATQGSVAKPRPPVTAVAVAPDGKGYLVGSQAGVYWHADAEEPIRLAVQLEHVHAFAFSPDGKSLAVAGGTPGDHGAIELWSWPDRTRLVKLSGHEDTVYDVVWGKDAKLLISAGADRTVRVWDATAKRGTATLKGHSGSVLSLSVSPSGTLLCSGSTDQTIRVWELPSGKLLRSLNNHLGPVHGLAFQPGNETGPLTLASAAGDGTVRIWHPATGRMVRILRHPTAVYAVAWCSRGETLWSGGKDGHVRQLDPTDGTLLHAERVSAGWVISLAACPRTDCVLYGDTTGRAARLPTKR